MGDRANIVINSAGGSAPRIFLYTHSSGYILPVVLKQALVRGASRWDDEQYLGRIIFNEMTRGNEMELTSFGISTYLCDNEYDLIVVNADQQTIWLENEAQTSATQPISFAEYVKLPLGQQDHDPWDVLKDRLGSKAAKAKPQQAA